MKLLALCLAAFLILAPALAESESVPAIEGIDLSMLEEYSKQTGVCDAWTILRRVLLGELTFEAMNGKNLVDRAVRRICTGFRELIGAVALPAMACLLLSVFPGQRRNWSRAAELMCRVACALALIGRYRSAAQLSRLVLERAAGFVNVAAPVLSSMLALSGSPVSVALAPNSAICVDWIETLLRDFGMPVCALAAVVAASSDLSDRFRLDRLFEWLKKGVIWGTSALLAGFTGLMSLEGLMASVQDNAASRAARQAVTRLIPIIGGSVSDALTPLTASLGAIRSAVGLTGILVLLLSCCGPLLQIVVEVASIKLAAAVLEPMAQTGVSRTLAHFGELAEMLLAISIGGVALALLLTGACLVAVGAAV